MTATHSVRKRRGFGGSMGVAVFASRWCDALRRAIAARARLTGIGAPAIKPSQHLESTA
jgi:hypothetical protein